MSFKHLVKRAALPAPQPHPGFFSRMRNAFRHGLNKVKGAVQTAVTKLVQVKDKVKETAKTVVNATKGGALRLWESSGKKIRTVGSIAATLVGKASEYMAPLVGNIPVVGKALQPMLKAYAMTAESVGKGLAGSNGDGSGSFKDPFVKDMEERVGSRDERGRFHADGKKITGRVVEMAI